MLYTSGGANFKMTHSGAYTQPPQEVLKLGDFVIPHGKMPTPLQVMVGPSTFRKMPKLMPTHRYEGGENGFPSDHAYMEASFRLSRRSDDEVRGPAGRLCSWTPADVCYSPFAKLMLNEIELLM